MAENEYGDDFPAYPVNGVGAATDLSWTKVQRHLARLVKEGRFFTQKEQDRFEDIYPAAIREHLEQAGDKPSAFVDQVMANVERIAEQETNEPVTAPPTVREIYDHYKPMVKELVLADEQHLFFNGFCIGKSNISQHTFAADGSEEVYSIRGSPFLLYYLFALSKVLLYAKIIEMV